MLKIQEFIGCFDDIPEASVYLKRNLNIECEMYGLKSGDDEHQVFLLHPGRKADLTNPLVQETNCLILYPDGDVLARAWHLPDVVEKIPARFDLVGSTCEELPDGEIVVVYNIEGSWVIGTGTSVDGSNYLDILGKSLPGFTYESEIKTLLRSKFGRWSKPFENTNPMMCFVFNYVTPYAPNVMPIIAPELYLTGVVNSESGHEVSAGMVYLMANQMGFAAPTSREIHGNSSLAHRIDNLRTLAPGLMLRDQHDYRVIIPNPIYKTVKNAKDAGDRVRPVHIAKILQACRDKADLETIRDAYQCFSPMLKLLWTVQNDLIDELIMLWSVARDEDLIDFAATVQHHPFNYILFLLRNNKTLTIKEEIDTINPSKLVRITEKRWEKEFDTTSRLLKYTGGLTDGAKEEGFETENGCLPYSREGD